MSVVSLLLIVTIYAALAIGQVPGLKMNRATIALVGAALLVLLGTLSEEEAFHAIDVGTLLLLGAMMVINVNLRMAGFFRFVTNRTLRMARTPGALLALLIGASGVLSAFFLNDTICLMLTPLVTDTTLRLKRNPMPYLIGLAVATNVGSVATITGNPQNIIIGQSSGIPYVTFAAYLGPIAIMGLAICWLVLRLAYRSEFKIPLEVVELPPPRPYNPLLTRSLGVVLVMLVAFSAGAPIVTVACSAAGALLISKLRPSKLLAIDWELLALFSGLFVVTGAIETSGLSAALFEWARPVLEGGVAAFSLAVGVLSNVVSNVPAVLLLRPEMNNFANPQQAWLTLAMASTLAGNLTLLGSAATLIVAELARMRSVQLSFMEFLRVGVPITILTMIVGIGWLTLMT
ncbi:MAG: anion transporter [Anaerolineae bacterium]|nr:anion transporter [Anaerolineae bacterium]MDW8173149.1 anion transporter [Anaerolineae bacterium]